MLEQRSDLHTLRGKVEWFFSSHERKPDPEIVEAIEQGIEILEIVYPGRFLDTMERMGTPVRFPVLEGTVGYANGFLERVGKIGMEIVMASTREQYENFIESRPTIVENAVRMLQAAGVQEITPKILVIFFLSHEAGHVDDAMNREGGYSDLNGQRISEMQLLPYPDFMPSDILATVRSADPFRKIPLQKFMQEHDMQHNAEAIKSLVATQDHAYLALPSEAYANAFAQQTVTAALQLGLLRV